MDTYEYTTVIRPGAGSEALSASYDEPMKKLGWSRAWSEFTTGSVFIVYRRPAQVPRIVESPSA